MIVFFLFSETKSHPRLCIHCIYAYTANYPNPPCAYILCLDVHHELPSLPVKMGSRKEEEEEGRVGVMRRECIILESY